MKDKKQTCHELVRESMDVEQERQKTYCDRSTIGPQYQVGDLEKVFNPTMKNLNSFTLDRLYYVK